MPTLPAPDAEIVILDVETTGFKPEEGHEIVEVAGERVRGREVLGRFVSLVLPSRPLDPDAAAVHGITMAELLSNGRPPASVIPEFVDFCRGAVLVGHNVAFDLGFLNAHLRRLNLPTVAAPTLDTVELARQLLILPNYSLGRVAAFLKVPQERAHRALADVQTTREVLFRLLERAAVRR